MMKLTNVPLRLIFADGPCCSFGVNLKAVYRTASLPPDRGTPRKAMATPRRSDTDRNATIVENRFGSLHGEAILLSIINLGMRPTGPVLR